MNTIFLSTAVIAILALTGCGSNGNSDTNTTTQPAFTTQTVADRNITEGGTSALEFLTTDIDYAITGGRDAGFFQLIGQKLSFKNPQAYRDGQDNSFKVEVTATTKDKKGTPTKMLITVNITKNGNLQVDTTAPTITTGDLNMTIGGTATLTANESATFALTQSNGFALTAGGVLTAPNTEGNYTISVTATDLAPTPNTSAAKLIGVMVTDNTPIETNTTVPGTFSTVVDSRITWSAASTACAQMAPAGTWELPTFTQLADNNVSILNSITVDSDGNSSTPQAFNSVLWSSTNTDGITDGSQKKGLFYDNGTAKVLDRDVSLEYYYTCIKK